jgi:exodeoxyribonuclease VII small subunit
LHDSAQPYEDNLARLRLVVEQLERGSLSLDDSLKLFEEGMELSRLCDGQLATVEERVKVLVSGQQPPELSTRKDIDLEIINVERPVESRPILGITEP